MLPVQCAELYGNVGREESTVRAFMRVNRMEYVSFLWSLADSQPDSVLSGRFRARSKEWSAIVVARKIEGSDCDKVCVSA